MTFLGYVSTHRANDAGTGGIIAEIKRGPGQGTAQQRLPSFGGGAACRNASVCLGPPGVLGRMATRGRHAGLVTGRR